MPSRPATTAPTSSLRSWLIWLTAAIVYVLAVFHRTSLGVAGLDAAERFGVGSTALATFTFLQISVYAAMQVPTGVLVDRFGPRRILIWALVFLGLGQVLLAVSHTYALALVARGVVGLGDALTFVSVLRLAANHFPGKQYMLVTALTGALGFVGNLVATLPLTLLLAGPGWTPTFLVAGLATFVFTVVVTLRVRDTPTSRHSVVSTASASEVALQFREALRTPGTRLGFWTHFSTPFSHNVLVLLWGLPFLVDGQGYSATTASSLLAAFVIGALVSNPVIGGFVGRRPEWRMPIVVTQLALTGVVWAALLVWPGQVPVAVLIPAFVILSLGNPCSLIGFALARDYNPVSRVGTATGIVNVGGFVATAVASLAIGMLLEASGGNYRIALLTMVAVLVFGAWRMLVWWRRARAVVFAAEDRGEPVPVRLRRHRWDSVRVQVERAASPV
ncbi:MFS transporter [Saccharomonospora azurea]|uniref:Lysosomal dipeptide transporter MFSD1 n=1 Tax=Saccharomonospora azurea NA-128 TaxID=882081 RepID=H8G628_9PSEU|nr:MFS transporter [Saccharomonospora azurea]EHK89057.1 sugar phosphate permease [Saccharomonospora azurea SZMC 14600]EHY91305.1 sugar phosphate permease [Saccharomonospora azurea NA-128]